MPDGTQQSNELPQRSREIDNVKYGQIGPEPKTPYAAKYPFNYSVQSQSGHIIEVDDTSNAERLLARHKNGSYVEMSKDNMVYKASGDAYTIIANNDTIYVGGTVNIHVVGTANVNIDGAATLTAASWTVNGDVQLNGKLTATGDVTAGSISLENHTHSDPQGGTVGKPQ
jgi:phage baseplate assembly protein gpV